MKIVFAKSLYNQLKNYQDNNKRKPTMLKDIDKKSIVGKRYTTSSVAFINRLIHQVNTYYQQSFKPISSLNQIDYSDKLRGYTGEILNNNHVFASFIVAYSNKAGNVYLNQQGVSMIKQRLEKDPHWFLKDNRKFVLNTYDLTNNNLATSMKLTLRVAKTLGYDIIPFIKQVYQIKSYENVNDLFLTYHQEQKEMNKNGFCFLAHNHIRLTIYNSNSLGTTLNQYLMYLSAIYLLHYKHDAQHPLRLEFDVKVKDKNGLTVYDPSNSQLLNILDKMFNSDGKQPIKIVNYNSQENRFIVLYWGEPGTGKSYHIQQGINENNRKQHIYNHVNEFNLTFYPHITQANFIGGFRPDKRGISYHPGVFALAMRFALKHPKLNTYLKIEEINHAKDISSVFGAVWQTLGTNNGAQFVQMPNLASWLLKQGCYFPSLKQHKIALPSNLKIIATENLEGNRETNGAGSRRIKPYHWSYQPYGKQINELKLNDAPIQMMHHKLYSWDFLYQYLNYYMSDIMKVSSCKFGLWFLQFSKGMTEKQIKNLTVNKLFLFLYNHADVFTSNRRFTIFNHRIYNDFGEIEEAYMLNDMNESIFSKPFSKGLKYCKELMDKKHKKVLMNPEKIKVTDYLLNR